MGACCSPEDSENRVELKDVFRPDDMKNRIQRFLTKDPPNVRDIKKQGFKFQDSRYQQQYEQSLEIAKMGFLNQYMIEGYLQHQFTIGLDCNGQVTQIKQSFITEIPVANGKMVDCFVDWAQVDQHDMLHGIARFISATGRIYEAMFVDGQMNGLCRVINSSIVTVKFCYDGVNHGLQYEYDPPYGEILRADIYENDELVDLNHLQMNIEEYLRQHYNEQFQNNNLSALFVLDQYSLFLVKTEE